MKTKSVTEVLEKVYRQLLSAGEFDGSPTVESLRSEVRVALFRATRDSSWLLTAADKKLAGKEGR